MNKLFFLNLDSIYGENFEQIQLEFRKMNPNDEFLSFCARNIVKRVAASALKINPDDVVFLRHRYGKPYIKGYSDFHFNISHTKNAIVVAISNSYVGVDVERVRGIDARIPNRFFAKGERQYVSLQSQGLEHRFFEIWTQKEAYLKWTGDGLTRPLKSFDVTDTSLGTKFQTITKDGYIISVCSSVKCDGSFKIIEVFERFDHFSQKDTGCCGISNTL